MKILLIYVDRQQVRCLGCQLYEPLLFINMILIPFGSDEKHANWRWCWSKEMTDPTIAKYENETRQITSMKWVLVTTIVAGTLLMMMSIVAPFIVLAVLHALSPSSPQQSILTAAQQFTTAPRDVLPFATALVGFAGGVVTAMYRTGTAQGPPPQSSSGHGTADHGTAGQGAPKIP